MAEQFQHINMPQQKFIEAQQMFFVGTAAADGRVNISPKGMDSLRVLGPNRIVWRNFTGSGNETAGHLAQVNRMTLMWCGFEQQAMIMRAYGSACTLHQRDAEWDKMNALFPAQRGMRQIYDMQVEILQTSCGYAVPFFDHAGDRDTLKKWTDARDDTALRNYHTDCNTRTIDGMPTFVTGDNT